MPTVIDSLVIELGMDPAKFNAGQRDAINKLRKFEEDAVRSAKGIEATAKRTDNMIAGLKRGFVGLLGGAAGGLIGKFVLDVVRADAALGRFGYRVNISTETLSAWQNAIRQVGGQGEEVTAVFGALSQEIQNFQLGRGAGDFLQLFNSLDVSLYDANRQLRSMDSLITEVASKLEARYKDPASRAALLTMVPGMSPGMIDLLIKGRGALADYLEEGRRAAQVTEQASQQAQEFERQLSLLTTTASGMGKALLNYVIGPLTQMLQIMRDMFSTDATQGKGLFGFLTSFSMPTFRVQEGSFADRLLTGGFGDYHKANQLKSGTSGGRAGSAPPVPLRLKPGAGVGPAHPGTMMLASALQDRIPGLDRFTAINDAYHSGRPSAHNRGLALDFTVKNRAQAAEIAQQVRQHLRGMGVNATVLDEYSHPSPFSTGGHIHVQFATPADAARYAGMGGRRGALSAVGGGGTTSIQNTTNVGTVVVQTQATDAQGIAQEIGPKLRTFLDPWAFDNGAQ